MAAVVSIVSGRDFFIHTHCDRVLQFLRCMGVVDIDIRVSSHLKEELVWAADKQLQVISTIMLFEKLL